MRRLVWPALAALAGVAAAEADGASLVQVLRAAQPGRRLVSLMFQQRSRYFQFDPYMHFGMYYQVERGGRARYNFAEAPWTPVRFRRDALPVPEPSDWYFRPERFDARREGPDTDYVLIRGRSSGPGPPFVLRERVGSWSLYARWRRPASPVIHLHQ